MPIKFKSWTSHLTCLLISLLFKFKLVNLAPLVALFLTNWHEPVPISIIFDSEELQAPRGKKKKKKIARHFALCAQRLFGSVPPKSNKPQLGFKDY